MPFALPLTADRPIPPHPAERAIVAAMLGGIAVYRYTISPLLGAHCRFAPSCSAYAGDALRRYGLRRGMVLSLRRLLRCHPWHPGGWDPVR